MYMTYLINNTTTIEEEKTDMFDSAVLDPCREFYCRKSPVVTGWL